MRTAITKASAQARRAPPCGPFARAATASLVGVGAPLVVINLIVVERVFAVQGFFVHSWKATGRSSDSHQDGLPHGVPPYDRSHARAAFVSPTESARPECRNPRAKGALGFGGASYRANAMRDIGGVLRT